MSKILASYLELSPDTEIPSTDTLLRGIKGLSELDIQYTSHKEASYAFNKTERLNELMLVLLSQTGQLKKECLYDLNFDHYFIPTEKYDTLLFLQQKAGLLSRYGNY